MIADEVAGLHEVAAALGRSEGWLMRNWLKIHRAHGFPRKHPTGWTWPSVAVATWLRDSLASFSPPSANDNHAGGDDAWSNALDARYGGSAPGDTVAARPTGRPSLCEAQSAGQREARAAARRGE